MADSTALPRPRQVTMGAIVGVVASVLLVVSLFDALGRVRSVETRTAIEDFLSRPPGDGLGLAAAQVTDLLHGLVFVNGALAAVAAVCALYTFWGHRAARVVFSVAAVALVLTSPVTGGALALMVALAASLLWSRPARDWFAGRAPQPVTPSPERRDLARVSDPSGSGPQGWQPPGGWARPDGSSPAGGPMAGAGVVATATRPGGLTQPVGPGTSPMRRPVPVTVAVLVSAFFSSMVLVTFVGMVLVLLVDPGSVLDMIESESRLGTQVSTRDLLSLLWVVSAVCIVWSLASTTLAFLTFRRANWARVLLCVSSVVAGLLALVAGPVGWVIGAACALTVALLLAGSSRRWFAGAAAGSGSQAGPTAGPTSGSTAGPVGPTAGAPRPKAKRQVW